MRSRSFRPVFISISTLLVMLVAGAFGPTPGRGQETAKFTPESLADPKIVELGRKTWQERCVFCHGRMAYPGKAPRLDPSRYTPEFVYDRVTNGFRAMPPWKDAVSEEERRAVTIYVMSQDFSN